MVRRGKSAVHQNSQVSNRANANRSSLDIQKTQSLTNLAESDDLDSLADFLRSWDVPEVSIRKSLKICG